LGPDTAGSVGDRQLLWVDLTLSGDPPESPIPLEWLPFPPDELAAAWSAPPQPRLTVHGSYFLARLAVPLTGNGRDSAELLDLAIGRNVILTAHRRPIPFLAELNVRITADTSLGELDAADFASVLLDGVVTSYLERTDAILARVDVLDGDALESRNGNLLSDLVALRHRIAATRRALVAHRAVMVAMAGADFFAVTEARDGERYAGMTGRFEGAVDAIDAAREALIGTFDIHMSRTAQHTNEVMKILTVASILLLPTGVIAGFMGMNIQAPYSNNDPLIFWVVVVLIMGLAVATLAMLRLRRWL
ncbi:MAG TPA: CorA family divalent cation transporter, partial [Candidatus Limnocylindrales bacterium]